MTAYEHMWQEIGNYYKGKRCLVTGAAGFIGKKIVNTLYSLGAVVHGIDSKPFSLWGEDAEWCATVCDVTRKAQIEPFTIRFSPEVIFHLAAVTEVNKSYFNPYDTYTTNINGTLNILEAGRGYPHLKSLVIASTDKVYGLAPVPYKEESELERCTNPYAASKQYMDRMCQDYARFYNLPVRILRCCNVYGPCQLNATTLITSAILNILSDKKAVIAKGNHEREWMYVDDCVLAYLLIGMVRDTDLRVYNVGSGETATPVEIVTKVIGILGKGDYQFIPENSNITDFNQRVDSSSFRYDYPYWKATPLQDGLQKTCEWYKEWKAKEKGVIV